MRNFYILTFLSLFLLGGFLPKAEAQAIWDGTADITWYVAGQSSFDISTAEQLAGIAQLVNNQGVTFNGVTLNLTSNIWLNGEQDSTNNWIPIGGSATATGESPTSGNAFEGHFKGNGYSVYNLYCDRTSFFHAGFFGAIKNPAVIDSLVLINPVLKSQGMMGAIVGFAKAGGNVYISNCMVINTRIYGTGGNNTGGIIGASYPNAQYLAGITYINNCGVTGHISGKYIGGIAGNGQKSYLTNTYFAGTLTPTSSDSWGGLLGYCNAIDLSITNSYCNLPSPTPHSEGRDGQIVTDAVMQSPDFITTLGPSFMMDNGINNGYPIMSYMCGITPNETEICLGEYVTLTAQGYDYYSWSNGETTESITVSPTTTTTYTVTGSTISGGSGTHSATVTVHPQATITASIMPSADGQIHGTVTPETSTINCGSSDLVTLTVTPDANYHISKVLVNGIQVYGDEFTEGETSITIDPNGTLADVKIFLSNVYYITSTIVLDNGTPVNNSSLVQPYGTNGVYSATPGDTVHYTFNETARYHIVDITIDDVAYGVIPSFVFEDVHESHTISATYMDACGIAELPFHDSFENAQNYSVPECYGAITNEGINASNSNAHSGSKSVYSYMYVNSHYYFVLPRIVDTLIYPINTLQVSFWAKSTSAANSFTVGVLSDPNNASTFSPIQTHTLSNTDYTQFITYFNNYDMSEVYGDYIAIKFNPGANYSSVYIDDINVDIAASCSPIQNLEITSLYGSNVTLAWDTNVVGGTSEYNISLYDVANDYTIDYVSYEPTLTITGLSENTQYRIGVYVYCANGEYSDTSFVSFMTPCNSPVAITVDSGNPSTSNVLPSNIYYNYSYTQQIVPASELGGTNQDLGAIAVQYTDNTSSNRVYEIYLAHVPNTANLASGWIIPDGANIVFTQVFSGAVSLNNSGEDNWYKINFDTIFPYNGTDNLLVAFRDMTGSYSSNRYFQCHEDTNTTAYMARYDYRDPSPYSITAPDVAGTIVHKINNFQFFYCEASSCISPNTLTVTDITASSAEITWITVGTETDWEVEYKRLGDTVWTSFGIVSGSPYVYLSPLTPDTYYSVRVRAACSITEFSNWSDAIEFHTPCDAITVTSESPWTENFEGYAVTNSATALSSCWATPETFQANNGVSPFVYTGYAGSAYSGSNTLEMKGAPTMFALPEFTNDINTLSISFWGNTTASDSAEAGTLLLGVISDVTDPTSFVAVDTIPATAFNRTGTDAPHTNFIGPFDFSSVTPESGLRIAIRLQNPTTNSISWNLDDFTVFLAPECPSPQKNSITFSDTTARSITISWIDEDITHDSWTVYYKPSADSVWTPAIAGPMPSITLNDLTPDTSYDVYVITNCASQDAVPDATFTKSFRTLVSCPAPTGLVVLFTSAYEANLAWSGSASSYIIEYGSADTTAGNSTIVTTTSNTITLTGLTANTLYNVSVQADCGSYDGTSAPESTTFYTDCETVTDFPYTESFETTLNCWDVVTIVGNSEWYINTGLYYNTFQTPDGNNHAYSHAYTTGYTTQLISPTFDLTSVPNPWVKFSHIQTAWVSDQDQLYVYYKTSPTATPILLTTYEDNISSWREDSLLLPNPTSEYQIIFEAHLNWGRGVGLDNVIVYDGVNLIEPTVVTHNATDISETAATLNGEISDPGNQTIISSGFEWKETNGGTYTSVSSTGSSTLAYYLTNLADNTSYTYRAYATTANATTYGDEITFTTLEIIADPCDAPTNVQAIPATHSATITWTSNESAWIVEHKTAASSNWTASSTLSATSYTISGLEASTDYVVRVKSVCSDNEVSDWSAEVTFTTLSEEISTYTITASASGPGSITPNGTITVQEGEDITFTFVPDEGAVIDRVLIDGVEDYALDAENSYTFTNVIANHTITVEFSEVTGIEENNLDAAITLYPNPADNYVEIRINGSVNTNQAVLYNAFGQAVETIQLTGNHTRLQLDNLAAGIYFIRINSENMSTTKRFIKR